MDFKEQGNKALANNDVEGAIEFYSRAIEEDNSQSIFYSNRAIAYKRLGQIDKAMDDTQSAIEIDEKNIKAQFVMALCQLIKGQRAADARMVAKGEKRLRNAHGMCRSQKKDQFEKKIYKFILRARKLKFVLEERERLRDLEVFYQTALAKINSDAGLSAGEKKRKTELLDRFIDRDRYDYKIESFFFCPLSGDLLLDPAITKFGNTFQREHLEEFVKVHRRDPTAGHALAPAEIYPNLAMRDAVETFLQENPWAFEFTSREELFGQDIDFN